VQLVIQVLLELQVLLVQSVLLAQQVQPQLFLAQQVQQGLQVLMVVQQTFLIMRQILQAQLADQVQVIFVGVMQHKLTQLESTLITLTIQAMTLISCLHY
jgi:hypothetical protein